MSIEYGTEWFNLSKVRLSLTLRVPLTCLDRRSGDRLVLGLDALSLTPET